MVTFLPFRAYNTDNQLIIDTMAESLTSINIPDSVTSIGNMAFRYCENLNPQIKNDIIKRFGTIVF